MIPNKGIIFLQNSTIFVKKLDTEAKSRYFIEEATA